MSASPPQVRAVLFDLDGTLADTAPDLAAALNKQLQARDKPALPVAALRPYVSQGARGMVFGGFGLTPGAPGYGELRDEFLALYEADLCNESALFPGMEDVICELEARAIAWGIVTNKAQRYTRPLVTALGLMTRANCVVSGDTMPRAKPHPDSLLEASRLLDVPPAHCLYVGDDERDVQASLAAGMTPVVALYGYLGTGKPPQEWGATLYIDTPLGVLKLLG